MEGGDDEVTAGMIPRAIDMIFMASNHLKDRGWKYHMEGQFLEVYNEVVRNLIANQAEARSTISSGRANLTRRNMRSRRTRMGR
jgi:hypothetical protein